MKITQEADYALRMMYRLAVEQAAGDSVVGAATLAESVAVPTRFGLKILHKLSAAGVVETTRGATGGCRLNVPASELTMRHVIETIDGPVTLNRCVSGTYECGNNPDKSACRVHHVFETLNAQVTERLDRITFATLVNESVGIGDLLAIIR